MWRYRAKDQQQQPILYTNFLLRCFLNSITICVKESTALKSLVLDGIPLSPKYLRLLCDGFVNNISLDNLSLPRCNIGDTGCDMLLNSLRDHPNLKSLDLCSCCLTNRSIGSLSSFLKMRNVNTSRKLWKDLNIDKTGRKNHGLHTLLLNKNNKLNDSGIRRLMHALKDDLCLKILGLRYCGITKTGAETIFECLRMNDVLTTIDLRDNDIPNDILRSIVKILRRKNDEANDRNSMNKKSDRRFERDSTFREKKSNRINTSRRLLIADKITENTIESYHEINDSVDGKLIEQIKLENLDNFNEFDDKTELNLQELQLRLANMISLNEALEDEIKKKGITLEEEKTRRTEAERTCEKIKSLLERLKDKIIVRSRTRSEEDRENQAFDSFRSVLRVLQGLSTAGKLPTIEMQENHNEE
ncbi:protein Cep78 homolog [Polistes fuscatus]|uniref:protein Cep78 homolog n=1 Tax=Polistes fuscatus TaxID=30207 RepID=UPI001CA864D6|nr:protein Cep78 homolog [Polistes fuscatus]